MAALWNVFRGLRLTFVLAAGLAAAFATSRVALAEGREQTPAVETPSPHAMAQVARLQNVRVLVANDQLAAARAVIAMTTAEVRGLAGNDPRHVDGEEMQVALLAAQGDFAHARARSESVVMARRAGPPSEQLLLCWSLLQHTIILDGVGERATADRAMQEAILGARHAFLPGDKRHARLLEAFAEMVAALHRPLAAIPLFEAAIDARDATPGSPRLELAETLRKLANLEPAQGLDVSADAHLERAIAILQAESAAAKDARARAEIEADMGTLYLSRIGIAAKAQRFADAHRMLVTARAHATNTPSGPYVELIAAETDRREAEARGDTRAAITAIRRGIDMARALPDTGLVPLLELEEGRLQIEAADFDGAETTINRALQALAAAARSEGTKIAEGWLLLARIERARGHEARATRWVTAALAILKTHRSEVAVLYGTNRAPRPQEPEQFGSGIAPALSLGEALVLVPGTPPVANTGLSILGGVTALEHLQATNIKGLARDAFDAAAQTQARRAKLYPGTALVFVHGFGTTFEFALKRAAQISRDIAYDGPTFAFTWPSQGKTELLAYGPDETAATASVDALVEFLEAVAEASGARSIHIIAHSMGNQVLLKALARIQGGPPDVAAGLAGRLGELVFASPDVGQAEFKAQTATLKGRHMTLYASAYDKALWFSFMRNAAVRAGSVTFGLLSSGKPVITAGVDSIDVSGAGRDYFGANHDVYASNPYVANDLRRLLQSGERPPHRRSGDVLEPLGRPPEQYWTFSTKAGIPQAAR